MAEPLVGKKRMMELALFDTSWGWMGVLFSGQGLRRIILPQQSREAVISQSEGCGLTVFQDNSPVLGDLPQKLKRYFAGEEISFTCQLDLTGTSHFYQRVWQLVQTIPYGETRSYGWVARELGSDGSARAVGQAMARNPLPILIPCHRVIRGDGALGGFSGGLGMKERLLRLESGMVKS